MLMPDLPRGGSPPAREPSPHPQQPPQPRHRRHPVQDSHISPDLLTISEVARMYRVSADTVEAAVHSGAIEAYRPGTRRYVLVADSVARWWASRRFNPQRVGRPRNRQARR